MKFVFWKHLMTVGVAAFATAALVACGSDSGSSAESENSSDSGQSEEEIAQRCYEKFGTTEDDTWAETLSGNEFISNQVCESISEYMGYQLAFYARCSSADYNFAKNRFDIEVITEQKFMHIWAEMDGCSYKLGTDGDMEPLIAKGRQWTLDDCLCRVDVEKTLYREIKPADEMVESSSSFEEDEPSSSTRMESSSSIEKISSSSQAVAYDYVKIGNQEWMTKNLDVEVEGSSCYAEKPENCEKYGRVYTWSMAMGIDISYDRKEYGETKEPHQGICPDGSHLPSHEEWNQLNEFIKANPEYLIYFQNQYGGAYDYHGYYRDAGTEVNFMSSTEYDVSGTSYPYEYAWLWYIHDDYTYFSKDNGHKYTGAYVRCVKGEAASNTATSSSSQNSSSSSTTEDSSSSVAESSSSIESYSSVNPLSSSVVVSSSSFNITIKECSTLPSFVDISTVFENQKKASLPDTVEKSYKVHVYSKGVIDMTINVSVITAGPTKSKITSSTNSYGGVNTETIRNDGQVKVTNLKTGARYPASDAENDLTDYNSLFGTAAEYSQAEFDGSLWKLTPIDDSKPILFYSSCEEKIVKVHQTVGDTTNIYTYGYFDESADFPGAVKDILIERAVYMRDASMRNYLGSDSLRSTNEISVLSIRKRNVLPSKMFDI